MSTDPREDITSRPAPPGGPDFTPILDALPADPEDDYPHPGSPTAEERNLAFWCHLGGFLTFIVVPVVIWATKKDRSRFVDEHGKEALNFQIALTIYYLVGCLIFPAVMIFEIVVVIQACLAANRGQPYRYPLNIRFIK